MTSKSRVAEISAVMRERRQPTRGLPLLRRAGAVLLWGAALALGAFGTYFSFANYPLFGIGVVLVVLLLLAHSERRRRRKQRAWERVRRRDRMRSREHLERLDA
jgi:hypothetical protein